MLMMVAILVMTIVMASYVIVWRLRSRRRKRTAADPKIEREVGKEVRVSSAELPSDKNVDRREVEVCPATSSSSPLSAPGAGDEGEDRALSSLGTPGEPSASEDGSGGALEFEVFISFRWQDTANGFSWQLHEALKHRDIRAFLMDADADMLKTGNMMETASKAMNRAEVFIPIFSRGYAESTSCLEEIAKMVECKKLMLPVFYDVEPRDVRNQKGPFEAAFKRYEKDEGLDKKKLKAWRDALKETGEFKGYDVQNEADGQEGKFIHLIVKRVLDRSHKIDVTKYPVGLDSRVYHVMKLLNLEDYVARMIGIYGIGGVGKTTVAKAICNGISSSFEASCFLSDVKEVAKDFNGLVSLQQQLIIEVLNDKHTSVTSVSQGINVIKKRVHCKSALIVLDDVDDDNQIKALAGARDWFHPKSRIIITTRDKHVLNLQGIEEHEMYHLEELDGEQSLQLFSYHAFGRPKPMNKYVKLSKKVVECTGGLPLTLEVLGSLFFDKNSIEEWEYLLKTLKENQHKNVYMSLKLSYDGLDQTEKQIFLDIACFFVRNGKENAIFMWKDCNYFPIIGTKVLLHKSLIKISPSKDEFEMHDQIRDMGRQIILEEKCPGLRTRLWNDKEVLDVLRNLKGTNKIEGIAFHRSVEDLDTKQFEEICRLRLLRMRYARFQGPYHHLPSTLKWLEWKGCPLESLPTDFNLGEVVVLDLTEGMVTQVWSQGSRFTRNLFPFKHFISWFPEISYPYNFNRLRVLNLGLCKNLIGTPDFTTMPNLFKLILNKCGKLVEVHESIGHLKSLVFLSMQSCVSLNNLPDSVCHLSSLKTLDLHGCYKISALPEQLGDLISLKDLILVATKIKTLPESMTNMKNLVLLSLVRCTSLNHLPEQIGRLESLKELKLNQCTIQRLPQSIGQLTNLQILDAASCTSLVSLPECISNLKNLKQLFLDDTSIKDLPESIGLLKNLEELSLFELGIRELPDIFGGLTKLKVLNLCNPHLKVLPSSMFHLHSLERLYDVDCNWLEGTDMIDFSDLCSLTQLSIRGDNVYMLPSSLNSFPKLQVLTLNYCKNLKFIPTLPHSLTRLSASECPSLEKISNVSHLNALRSISLRDCTKLVDIPGLEKLRHLEELHLGGCSSLTHVVRDRIKVANFEHLLKMGISGTPTSSGGQISFVIPKVLNISRVQISIVGSFDCDQKLTGHIEIVKEDCLIFETRREAVYQYFCAFRFGEEDDMVRQIGSGNGYRIVRVSLDDGLITGGDIFVGTL
ncbi:disease resistance protein RPV1-like isoform X2 [Nymphaea colorata]|uniref:disease resistance protein RPV1-like isoform X2 n=1 Tax=Nymphaea colorata TaxID=210225 RepID=UPI00129EC295|nr:disease resistance protein RPV1-like isoform X2 [Nymphaea colorata]